jgi:peptide deformylase
MRIVHYPHPSLKHAGKPVKSIDKELRLQVGNMFELMYDAKGLGLAATQVALPIQLLVMNITGNPGHKASERVFINPTIVEKKGVMDGEEGCLSFPGMYAPVKRAKRVVIEAFDLEGKPVREEATGIASRAWQHEIDHLDGIVFIERFSPLIRLARERDIAGFVTRFKQAQEAGVIPPEAEIEKMLRDYEQAHRGE